MVSISSTLLREVRHQVSRKTREKRDKEKRKRDHVSCFLTNLFFNSFEVMLLLTLWWITREQKYDNYLIILILNSSTVGLNFFTAGNIDVLCPFNWILFLRWVSSAKDIQTSLLLREVKEKKPDLLFTFNNSWSILKRFFIIIFRWCWIKILISIPTNQFWAVWWKEDKREWSRETRKA